MTFIFHQILCSSNSCNLHTISGRWYCYSLSWKKKLNRKGKWLAQHYSAGKEESDNFNPASLASDAMLQKLVHTALHKKIVMELFYNKTHLVNYNIYIWRNIMWQSKWCWQKDFCDTRKTSFIKWRMQDMTSFKHHHNYLKIHRKSTKNMLEYYARWVHFLLSNLHFIKVL